MKVGDRVRVKESVIVYTHPKSKKAPFDIKGLEGDVIDILTDWQGRPISPNLPVLVKFEKKFRSHFRHDELEVISE
ncbi:Ferredoxin thioredoxin reductase variable alpha chain [Xenococcus sp. PCC 7305]|uniref:ferredoxin-thioredoxin reductase variable chain n=1 Tax=Xenococcus sp. PCC 7305 TaxID=102125 RepID=UPI0002AC4C2B|nr:ferredoxin-thioredoxin reductase variable chain [Xenococcus sp. PCC 7305]ELS02178.1 Ferredoxin thioredoxin reductase variable alpha chain [Xenococcus sp. PCC 7305]